MITSIGALKLADRAEWLKKVKAAISKHDGRIPHAADALGVSPRTLFRWVSDTPELQALELWAQGKHYEKRA